MSEPYARVPDVNQRVEFGITQGYKGPQAEHVRAL
jgi:cold shock CspA family protein